jgi:hypothetical protein
MPACWPTVVTRSPGVTRVAIYARVGMGICR